MMRDRPKSMQHDYFDATHLRANLNGRVVRGGLATFGAQGFGFLLNLVSTAVLARLLSPTDFGLVAMVTALTGIAEMFKDSGLSAATVQRESVTHEQISTLFWINVALSLGLSLCIAGVGPAIAWFYGEPRLLSIALAVAAIFVIGGFSIQHQALLRRQMHFSELARIQMLSASLAFVTAIAAALEGAGYWALLVQAAVREAAGVLLTWSHCKWWPGRPRRGVGIRGMLSFVGYLTGFSFINYFARNADNMFIGYAWGGAALGLYTKAYGLLTLPIQQVNGPMSAVAIPALSRLQDEPDRFREFYCKVLKTVTFITFPLIAWMIICSNEIVLVLLGPKWTGAVPIYLALSIAAFFQPIGNMTGALYISLGRTKRMLVWSVIGNTWLVLGFWLGLPYGPLGVAWAFSLVVVMRFIPLLLFGTHGTPVSLRDVFRAIGKPATYTCLVSGLGLAVYRLTSAGGVLSVLVSVTVAMVLGYLALAWRWDRASLRFMVRLMSKSAEAPAA